MPCHGGFAIIPPVKKLMTLFILTWAVGASLPADEAQPLTDPETALIQGAYDGKLAQIQVLVKKGVSVDAADANGRTALMWAALKGHTPIIQFLHGKGARLDARDKDGQTPLIYAARGSSPSTVEFLLKNGAEVNVQSTKHGISPLMTAAATGNLEVARLLLQYGADAELTDKDDITAQQFARESGHPEVAALLANPPDPTAQP
jgi:ankyrin repeat protein